MKYMHSEGDGEQVNRKLGYTGMRVPTKRNQIHRRRDQGLRLGRCCRRLWKNRRNHILNPSQLFVLNGSNFTREIDCRHM